MANNPFTLDIDEKYTKIVEAKKVGDLLEVSYLGQIETPEAFYTTNLEKVIESEVIQIKKLVKNANITKKNVNLIIPDSLTYNQVVSMPLLNEKELISAIKYQADQFIPMPIEETNIDIEVISEDQKEKKVLLLIVAVPKKIINRVQSTVEMAGLDPLSVENELSSVGRFINNFNTAIFNQFKANPDQGLVIANFDNNSTSFGYFSSQDLVIKESHRLSIGYQLFLKETQINTNIDVKKVEEVLKIYDMKNSSPYPIDKIILPLIKEFSKELRLFISKYNPSIVLFTNKIFLFPSLVTSLSNELSLPISILNPYTFIKKSQLIETYKNELSVFVSAFGGCLR